MSLRSFFVAAALALAGLVMVGCAPAPTPEVVEVIVKETTIVENVVEVIVPETPGPSANVIPTFYFSIDKMNCYHILQ